MAITRLNWASATVRDSELAVDLDGELPAGWKKRFKATARLLGHGDWGAVTVKKHTVHVPGVTAGSEEKLRHYLESVVEQANAALAPPESEAGVTESDPRPDQDTGPDTRMTERFRSFAETDQNARQEGRS